MGVFYGIQCAFIILLICVLDLGRSVLYPSIQWTPHNPIFAANRTQCVLPMSKLIFVCPNTATIVTRLNDTSGLDPHYENLWLVSRRNYERCEVNKSSDRKLIPCDMPFTLKYYTAIFKRYSASNDPVFKPGQDYYFIATSDGSQSSINSISGGHCKAYNMKLKFHVCTSNEDPRCQSDELCNGVAQPAQAHTTGARTANPPTTATTSTTQRIGNTSYTNYTLPITRISHPDDPENEKEILFKESTYHITIGFLVSMCFLLLIISVISVYRLHQKKKANSSSSRDSASFNIRLNDSPDGSWD
ncbi:Ephrin-B2a [Desmophyllum pertusum]|uniref:Ephrin-B2a n=1 Tax=Desmophyllum pertusum TaxID=174260 RepID=A0A9X0A5N3_9CNID|nr:Ephrin-B2a [Desmophyllum pertusum]